MNQKATVRNANKEDIISLNTMFCSLSEYNSTHIKVPKIKKHDRKKDVRNALKNKDGRLLIAEINKEPAGYIYAYEVENPGHIVIEHLLVLEKFRSKGIGEKLIKSIEKWGKTKDKKLFEIEVFDWNKPALEFYEHEGFKEDSLLLTKKV